MTTLTAVPITTTTYGGPSGPHLIIGNDLYTFTPDDCVVFETSDAIITGPGRAPNGDSIYVALQIGELRVDIGTDEIDDPQDVFWVAGERAANDMDVTIENFLVMAEGTFTNQRGRTVQGLLRADCS